MAETRGLWLAASSWSQSQPPDWGRGMLCFSKSLGQDSAGMEGCTHPPVGASCPWGHQAVWAAHTHPGDSERHVEVLASLETEAPGPGPGQGHAVRHAGSDSGSLCEQEKRGVRGPHAPTSLAYTWAPTPDPQPCLLCPLLSGQAGGAPERLLRIAGNECHRH